MTYTNKVSDGKGIRPIKNRNPRREEKDVRKDPSPAIKETSPASPLIWLSPLILLDPLLGLSRPALALSAIAHFGSAIALASRPAATGVLRRVAAIFDVILLLVPGVGNDDLLSAIFAVAEPNRFARDITLNLDDVIVVVDFNDQVVSLATQSRS